MYPWLINNTSSLHVSSLLLICSHNSSTFLSNDRSAFKNTKAPLGQVLRHSLIKAEARASFLPMIYTLGSEVCRASAFRVDAPMPLVAPAKTATIEVLVRREEFDSRTSERITML